MKIFSILSPAASLGLTAMGMPVAGMAAGSVFGALGANEMRKEQQEERKRAMLANADSIRYSYGRSSGQTPQLDVQPWMGENTALGAGAIQGAEQGAEFAKLFKKDKDGVQVLGEPSGADKIKAQVSGGSAPLNYKTGPADDRFEEDKVPVRKTASVEPTNLYQDAGAYQGGSVPVPIQVPESAAEQQRKIFELLKNVSPYQRMA